MGQIFFAKPSSGIYKTVHFPSSEMFFFLTVLFLPGLLAAGHENTNKMKLT